MEPGPVFHPAQARTAGSFRHRKPTLPHNTDPSLASQNTTASNPRSRTGIPSRQRRLRPPTSPRRPRQTLRRPSRSTIARFRPRRRRRTRRTRARARRPAPSPANDIPARRPGPDVREAAQPATPHHFSGTAQRRPGADEATPPTRSRTYPPQGRAFPNYTSTQGSCLRDHGRLPARPTDCTPFDFPTCICVGWTQLDPKVRLFARVRRRTIPPARPTTTRPPAVRRTNCPAPGSCALTQPRWARCRRISVHEPATATPVAIPADAPAPSRTPQYPCGINAAASAQGTARPPERETPCASHHQQPSG